MIKLLKYICIIIISIVIIDILIGKLGDVVIRDLNTEIHNGDAALVNYNLNKLTADVIIVGSSTAMCHYNPQIIQDSLSLYSQTPISIFNAGASTQGLAYDYALISSIIERKKPKMIILDLHYNDFCEGLNQEQISRLQPYYRYNKSLTDVFNRHLPLRNRILLKSNLYRFNTNFTKLTLSFLKCKGTNGFYAHEGTMDTMPDIEIEKTEYAFNNESVNDFIDIVNMCESNSISLYLIVSPVLNHRFYDSSLVDRVKQLCQENNIFLMDYKDDSRFQKPELYYDRRHLNIQGASLFSSIVISDILLKNNYTK